MSSQAATIEVEDTELRITNPDKVLFEDPRITKIEMVRYYQRVAPAMLAHVAGRPLVLQRFPDGISSSGFYQKNTPDHFPDYIDRVQIATSDGGSTLYPVIRDAAGLVYLAGQGTVVFHTLLSRSERPDSPVEVIFDLDPPSRGETDQVRAAASELHRVLDDLGLAPRVKSSGSKGLHLVVEVIDTDAGFELTRAFSRSVAELVLPLGPFTLEHRLANRHGRLFLDILRNSPSAHAVAPYSLRALPTAPVAAPLDWHEALGAGFEPRRVTLANLFRRLAQKADPWEHPARPRTTIAGALAELDQRPRRG